MATLALSYQKAEGLFLKSSLWESGRVPGGKTQSGRDPQPGVFPLSGLSIINLPRFINDRSGFPTAGLAHTGGFLLW